jgi:hypothetical protein
MTTKTPLQLAEEIEKRCGKYFTGRGFGQNCGNHSEIDISLIYLCPECKSKAQGLLTAFENEVLEVKLDIRFLECCLNLEEQRYNDGCISINLVKLRLKKEEKKERLQNLNLAINKLQEILK